MLLRRNSPAGETPSLTRAEKKNVKMGEAIERVESAQARRIARRLLTEIDGGNNIYKVKAGLLGRLTTWHEVSVYEKVQAELHERGREVTFTAFSATTLVGGYQPEGHVKPLGDYIVVNNIDGLATDASISDSPTPRTVNLKQIYPPLDEVH